MLKIADKILKHNPNIKDIKTDDFAKLLGIQWIEESIKEGNIHISSDITDNLVLCKINEKIGYGVFTLVGIPKDTVIGCYEGELIKDDYTNNTQDRHYYYKLDDTYSIDAKKKGNITRFINHLPTKNELDNLIIDDSVRSKVATSNVIMKTIRNVNGKIYQLFFTKRAIKAHEQLCVSYGESYWSNARMTYDLFDNYGEAINSHLYANLNISIPLSVGAYYFPIDEGYNFLAAQLNVECQRLDGKYEVVKCSILKKYLENRSGALVSVSKEFLNINDNFKKLYSNQVNSESLMQFKKTEAFNELIALIQSNIKCDTKIVTRNILTNIPQANPLDAIISIKSQEDREIIRAMLLENNVLNIRYSEGIIIPHVNSESMIKLIKIAYKNNPMSNYNAGVIAHNQKHYKEAIKNVSYALTLFSIKGELIKEGICYSTLASSFRDSKDFDSAITHCEAGILKLYQANADKELEKIINKYQTLMQQKDISIVDHINYAKKLLPSNKIAAYYRLKFCKAYCAIYDIENVNELNKMIEDLATELNLKTADSIHALQSLQK